MALLLLPGYSIDDEEGSERGLDGLLQCYLNALTVPCELNVHDEILI